jgi:tRNA uridine 5-carbamoylmethylation protein Kti12
MKSLIEPARCFFVVGTPGAGKSSFCRELQTILEGRKFKCSLHGDYPFLQLLFREDRIYGRNDRFRPDPKSEFVVTDEDVYDEALKMIYDKVVAPAKQNKGNNAVNIIEFSRPGYDTAFLHYTLRAMSECVIINLSAPIEVCNDRNEKRREKLEKKLINNPDIFDEEPDLHYVPKSVMQNYYAKDSAEDIQRANEQNLVLSLLPSRRYFVIDNSTDDKESFRIAVRTLVETAMLPLLESGESYEAHYHRRLKQIQHALSHRQS